MLAHPSTDASKPTIKPPDTADPDVLGVPGTEGELGAAAGDGAGVGGPGRVEEGGGAVAWVGGDGLGLLGPARRLVVCRVALRLVLTHGRFALRSRQTARAERAFVRLWAGDATAAGTAAPKITNAASS